MLYLIGVKIEGKYGLYVDNDGAFLGSENKEEALSLLPNYRENHLRSYEASASAVIYQMTFGFSLMSFKDMNEIKCNTIPTIKLARNVSGSTRFVSFKESYEPIIIHHGKLLPDDMKWNTNNMTKEQAKQAMREGHKVTHRYFSPEEWATMKNGSILLEDGVVCSEEEFWDYRTSSAFDNDWSLFNK